MILTARVGAGHDRPAYELAARLRARGAVVAVHDYLDALPRFGQVIIGDGYGVVVNRMPRFFDWLFYALEHRWDVRGIILTFLTLSERTVRRWTQDADVVVSTFPLSCQTLGRMRAAGRIDVPVVSYLTDPAPHRMWVHPGVDTAPLGHQRLRRGRRRALRRGRARGRSAGRPAVLPGAHRRRPHGDPP